MKKKIILLLTIVTLVGSLTACSTSQKNTTSNENVQSSSVDATQKSNKEQSSAKPEFPVATSKVYYETSEVTAENSADLRAKAKAEAKSAKAETIEEEILNRLVVSWGDWKPDYEGWLNWSNGLYTPDSSITAIGEKQVFHDYQISMKDQRDACDMEMGPIMNITVSGNEAALVYYMYLTPKGTDKTMRIIVTEFNTFKMVDGKLMVTDLHLYTHSGSAR